MDKTKAKNVRRSRRRVQIRRRITGTPSCPRLSVYRSLNHMYAQLVDDLSGRTLVACSTQETKPGKTGNASAASTVGTRLAEKARAAGVEAVVFDRGGFRYHGRVKALAEAARKGGLKF